MSMLFHKLNNINIIVVHDLLVLTKTSGIPKILILAVSYNVSVFISVD